MISSLAANSLAFALRTLTGVTVRYADPGVLALPSCVYFANHASHLDFLILWAILPPRQRINTSPVAAADYWQATRLRRHLAQRVFHALLIARRGITRRNNPLPAMTQALQAGRSLILFPEGTRAETTRLGNFRAGLYHLARRRPETRFVPVFLDNLNRVLPKGEAIPVPLICSASFGLAITLEPGEGREPFMQRARQAVEALRPHAE